MTLRHLEIFRMVCMQESITAAAQQLGMTQPAVSIAIRELESFYQARLFDRMNRRIYLTDAGHTLLQYADSISERFEASIDAMRGGRPSRRIRLGVNAAVGETRLTSLLSKLQSAVTLPDLRIIIDNSFAIEQRLMKNEIDLAIVDELTQPEQWTSVHLFTESMVVAGAPGALPANGKITVSALSGMNLLLREPGSGSRKCVEAVFQRHGSLPVPSVESASTMTLLNLAEAGFGVAILPRSMFDGYCAQRRLCFADLEDDHFNRRFYLIHHPRKYLTPSMTAAIDLLKA